MSEFVWYWTKGSTRIYTRNEKAAEKAMREGLLVMGIRSPSRIIRGKMI